MTAALRLAELDLSVRAYNALTDPQYGIARLHGPDVTVEDLIAMSAAELMRVPNFGNASLYDVRKALAQFGLCLRDEVLPPKPRRVVQIALCEMQHIVVVYALADDGTVWRNWKNGIGDNQWSMMPPLPSTSA